MFIILFLINIFVNCENINCHWIFYQYHPSDIEKYWKDNSILFRNKECDTLAIVENLQISIDLVRASLLLKTKQFKDFDEKNYIMYFSLFEYYYICDGNYIKSRFDIIEPLYGILRDPLTICNYGNKIPSDLIKFPSDESGLQSKRIFLPKIISWEYGNIEKFNFKKKILIDIGASTFTNWNNDPTVVGSKWINDKYLHFDFTFDSIICFEQTPHDPNNIFKNVPANILHKYVYYNMGVEKDKNSLWNPWNFIMDIANPEDFVVVKLDIDNSEIEDELVLQIITNTNISDRIDEFYYEHHVNLSPMNYYWKLYNHGVYLSDSYDIFTKLRMKGINAHSWP